MKYYLIFIIGALMLACSTQSTPVEEDPKSLRGQAGAIEVSLELASVKKFEFYIHTSGKIAAKEVVEIKSKANGIVKQYELANGDIVKKGQHLLALENEQQKLAVEKAVIHMRERQIQYESEMIAFGGSAELGSDKVNNIKENIRHTSGLASAQIALKEAQLNLAYTEVSAGINGVISDLIITPGNEIKAGDKICTLYNPNQLILNTEVLESEVGQLKIGQQAIVQTLANADQTHAANVVEINPVVNIETGMVSVKLLIKESIGLLPGMNATAVVKVPYSNHIVVPKEAIVLRSGKPVIFTMEDNLAKWNYVTLGKENGTEVEILEGLKEKQQVIISNNLQLAHDAPVQVTKTP